MEPGQPAVSAWADQGQPPRLVEQTVPAGEPKALACYGVLFPGEHNAAFARDAIWLRFVDGRPLSAVTTAYLAWCCERLAARGVRAWALIWDNAACVRTRTPTSVVRCAPGCATTAGP